MSTLILHFILLALIVLLAIQANILKSMIDKIITKIGGIDESSIHNQFQGHFQREFNRKE